MNKQRGMQLQPILNRKKIGANIPRLDPFVEMRDARNIPHPNPFTEIANHRKKGDFIE